MLRLAGHAGGVLRVVDAQQGWPALASVIVDGVGMPVTIWIGPVGRSHRGRDDVERRFQNPGSNRPIWIDDSSLPLLLGLWESDDKVHVATPVVVAADPLRRANRTTRFSVFVGLDLLLNGASSGWSDGLNSEGEPLRSFHPALLPRLVETLTATQPSVELEFAATRTATPANLASPSEMARLARLGLTLQEIGEQTGVSRERVRQVLAKNWPELARQRKIAAARSRVRRNERLSVAAQRNRWDALNQELRQAGIEVADVTDFLRKTRLVDKTAAHFRIGADAVKDLYHLSGSRFLLAEQPVPSAARFEDRDLIRYLRLAADELGVTTLTVSAYNDFAARQKLTTEVWPTSQTVFKCFGSWRDGCDAAGLASGTGRVTYYREYPAQRCRQFLDTYVIQALQAAEYPSRRAYAHWAKHNGGPSLATLRNRLGSWSDSLAHSLSSVDKE